MFGRRFGAAAFCLLAACGGEADTPNEVILMAQAGPFDGTLTIAPNPPQVGRHDVVITLDDAGGGPLEGAMVVVAPWMPAHGHGSNMVEAVEEAPGVYVAQDVWLNMPGIWDLHVNVEAEQAGDLVATVEVP